MNIRFTKLYCLTLAFLTLAFLAHAVVAQNIAFQDNFNISEDTNSDTILTPTLSSGRGTGYSQGTIKYGLAGGFSVGNGEVSGVSVVSQKLAFGTFVNNGTIRFYNVLTNAEVNFESILGDRYEVSYKIHGAWNYPVTFSMSDTLESGGYDADVDAEYDFAIRPWGDKWRAGEDGANLFNSSDSDADTEYSVRIVIDETVDDADTATVTEAQASVYIDDTPLGTHNIDFETNARYFQFTARAGYGHTLDDLTFASYAIPELSNTTLIFSLFALSICLSRRRFYSIRA